MNKIFVGNVPYQCTNNEFIECFKNIDGFLKGEIIKGHKNNNSRGFGFITFEKEINIEYLRGLDIRLKNRLLRFSVYQNNLNIVKNIKPIKPLNIIKINDNNKNINKNINYLVVHNLDDNNNKEYLKNIFEENNYNIGKHFIKTNNNTGEILDYGLVEIINKNEYDILLKNKFIQYNDIQYKITTYKTKQFKPFKREHKYFAYIANKILNDS